MLDVFFSVTYTYLSRLFLFITHTFIPSLPRKQKVSPADVVRFLVANGANTEAKDEDGMKLRCKI